MNVISATTVNPRRRNIQLYALKGQNKNFETLSSSSPDITEKKTKTTNKTTTKQKVKNSRRKTTEETKATDKTTTKEKKSIDTTTKTVNDDCEKTINGMEDSKTVEKKSSTRQDIDELSYWVEESDKVLIEYHESTKERHSSSTSDTNDNNKNGGKRMISKMQFKIHGNPRPLRRHRSSRGFMYNPSAGLQAAFRETVQDLIWKFNDDIPQQQQQQRIEEEEEGSIFPLFDKDEMLVMTILFRLRRPRNHFVGNKAGPGRLRESAPVSASSTRTDVDNLTKFVLDSMNEILYQDDKQIASLFVTKILDDEDMCFGSTEIRLMSVLPEDVNNVIEQSFQILDGNPPPLTEL